jgi:hypothetical protein
MVDKPKPKTIAYWIGVGIFAVAMSSAPAIIVFIVLWFIFGDSILGNFGS